MRKIILAGSVSLLFSITGNAQNIENWDFAVNVGNCNGCSSQCTNLSGGSASPTVEEGAGFPNWHVTHGSPNFTAADPDAIFLNSMRADNNEALGEGIAGGYNFVAGQTYTIGVGLLGGSDPATFHLVLVNGGMPMSTNCGTSNCELLGAQQGSLPYVNPLNKIELTLSSYISGNNTVTFTATQNFNWVWFYAQNGNTCSSDVVVDYVYVMPNCREDLYLNAATITAANYSAYKRIHAGSGNTSNMSLINAATQMTASESVTLVNNLDIRPTRGAVIAEIDRYSCDYPPVALPKPALPNEVAGKLSMLPSTSLNNVVITPNPTRDQITVSLPAGALEKTITLTGLNGSLLKTKTTTTISATISLNDYPAGMYFVRISSGKETIVKKVIKQ